METEMVAPVIDVARQATQPVPAHAGPQQRADHRDQQTANHHELAQIIHQPKTYPQNARHESLDFRSMLRKVVWLGLIRFDFR